MAELKIIPEYSNYAAVVCSLKYLTPIEGMTKIQIAKILGEQIVVSADQKIGDLGIFFPSGSVINGEFLSKNNLYRHNYLNADPTKAGFFEDSGRVKALKLIKGTVISTGFWIPIESISYLINPAELSENDQFNYVNEKLICEKYISEAALKALRSAQKTGNDRLARKFSRLIPNQFALHLDTSKLSLNLGVFELDSVIAITDKWHGTNATFAHVLVKKELNWREKLAKLFGVPVTESEYGYIAGSRRCVKSVDINEAEQSHFYAENVWETVLEEIKHKIDFGYTLYGEIVGFTPSGAPIQKNYDYSCLPKAHKFVVFRITYTTQYGNVIELSWQQIKDYCDKHDLDYVPEFFFGTVRQFLSGVEYDEREWREVFLKKVQTSFNMEQDCVYCRNTVPAEGVVVRLDGKQSFAAYKCKSKKFLLHESEESDTNNSSIEDEN